MPAFPRTKVDDLVALLGAPWHPAPDPHDGHEDYRRFVTDGRGCGFFLSAKSRPVQAAAGPAESWRVIAVGRYPEVPGYYEDQGRPQVGFSLDRPLEELARDLRRRFLPGLLAAHGRAVDAIHARAVSGGQREELARSILHRFPHPKGHFADSARNGLTLHFKLDPQALGSARLETSGDMTSMAIELTGLTLSQLERVLSLFDHERDGSGN